MDNKIKNIVLATVFLVCFVMIIIGQRNIGYPGLTIEIIGLIGILTVLFVYNKAHK